MLHHLSLLHRLVRKTGQKSCFLAKQPSLVIAIMPILSTRMCMGRVTFKEGGACSVRVRWSFQLENFFQIGIYSVSETNYTKMTYDVQSPITK